MKRLLDTDTATFMDCLHNGDWKSADHMLSKYPELRTNDIFGNYECWRDVCVAPHEWEWGWQMLRTYNRYRCFNMDTKSLADLLLDCFHITGHFNYGCFKYLVETFSQLIPKLGQYSYRVLGRIVMGRPGASATGVKRYNGITLDIVKWYVSYIVADPNYTKLDWYYEFIMKIPMDVAESVQIFQYVLSKEFAQLFTVHKLTLDICEELILSMVFNTLVTSHHVEILKYLLQSWEEMHGSEYVLIRLVAACSRFIYNPMYVTDSSKQWHRWQLWKYIERTACRILGVRSLVDAQEQIVAIQRQHIKHCNHPSIAQLYQYFEMIDKYFTTMSASIDVHSNLPCDVINSIVLSYV